MTRGREPWASQPNAGFRGGIGGHFADLIRQIKREKAKTWEDGICRQDLLNEEKHIDALLWDDICVYHSILKKVKVADFHLPVGL